MGWLRFRIAPSICQGPDVLSIVVASSNWQAQLAATVAQGGVAYVKENACCDCVHEVAQKARDLSSVVCIA
ncbi:hypothetical protein BDW75DRAFT_211920 [Aspergillus navahoensis]